MNKTPLTDTDGNPVIHGDRGPARREQEQTPPEGFDSGRKPHWAWK
ncbi:hypothetical protein OHD26_27555 [Escherichia coli]|nr:hypothetical protein [Escherichia coli]